MAGCSLSQLFALQPCVGLIWRVLMPAGRTKHPLLEELPADSRKVHDLLFHTFCEIVIITLSLNLTPRSRASCMSLMAFPGRSSNGSGSGRDQSRGRGSGSFIGARSRLSLPSPPKPLGPLLDSINTKTLLIEGDSPKIVDVEYVASYNWLDQKSPTILIPGKLLDHSPQTLMVRFQNLKAKDITIDLLMDY